MLDRSPALAITALGRLPANRLCKLSVLMPVYNERLTLRSAIGRVLQSPVPLDLEIVAVDDGSTDGSWEILSELAQQEPRLRAIRHAGNCGKGAAVRTAIQHMTGGVAVIQDADLEYDPRDLPRLLQPILEGRADAVFGSRFRGESRRVLYFWHSLANRLLTAFSNMVNDLNLTDMETCYKMVRADTLRNLVLRAESFTIEPELTARLAQWGGPIYEVPVDYAGRTYAEGKKVRAVDAIKALWEIVRAGLWDTRFTEHAGFYTLTSVARANRYNRWVLQKLQRFLGPRLLEAGAGIGSLSSLLLHRPRLVLVDHEPLYVARLQQRFGHLDNVRVLEADLARADDLAGLETERLDTILCSNVLEHIEPDEGVLSTFHRLLVPGGRCIVVVPAGPALYTDLDAELGHYRRYAAKELQHKMEAAGFEVIHTERVNRLGAVAWYVSVKLLGRPDGNTRWWAVCAGRCRTSSRASSLRPSRPSPPKRWTTG
jgi:glycosyltransferase involved in cell wall biosynthesis/predicted SAM-dependent methyltransferase